jgi:hypothetical protein
MAATKKRGRGWPIEREMGPRFRGDDEVVWHGLKEKKPGCPGLFDLAFYPSVSS